MILQRGSFLRYLRRLSLITLGLAGGITALSWWLPGEPAVPPSPPSSQSPNAEIRPLSKSNLGAKSSLDRDAVPASDPGGRARIAAIEAGGERSGEPAAVAVPAPPEPPARPRMPQAPWSIPPGATIPTAPDAGSLKPAYNSRFDDILKPVLAYPVSESDLTLIKDAVTHVYKDEFDKAAVLMRRIEDLTARKLVQWYLLRAGDIERNYKDIIRFREQNPNWPGRRALDARIETGLLFQETSASVIINHFRSDPPQTGAGKAALGGALIEAGDERRGKQLISEAWRRHLFDEQIEAKILQRFGKHLSAEDHQSRLNWLMTKDPKKKAAQIQRVRLHLKDEVPIPKSAKAVADADKARSAKIKHAVDAANKAKEKKAAADSKAKTSKPAEKAVPEPQKLALGKEAKQDVSLILIKVRELRRKNKYKEAWSLLRSVPKTAVGLMEGEDWWAERRIHVRAALNQDFAKTAYDIAQNHGLLTGQDLAEAEFLAGWIALRFLNQPAKARDHFAVAVAAGGLPKDKARSSYWLGRAELALNNAERAEAAFREASRHHHVFYGQLAQFTLTGQAGAIEFRPVHEPTEADVVQFYANDAVRALVIAEKAGLDTLIPVFLYDFARFVENPGEMALIAETALRIAPLPITVRFAKIAMNRGFALDYYGFPASLPDVEPLVRDNPVETALLHALSRQESEFNHEIVSPAGAQGLMQLMPATAQMVAKDHGLKYDVKMLKDPVFNVKLGTAFLQRMVNNYNGSYIMALAAYNAGPGRVRQWVSEFGDPRRKDVDPIDWIERIPFTETRDYVHKVMENVQMYRAKFNQTDKRLHLAKDIYRGRSDFTLDVMQAGGGN